jgi:hypothetical protein
MLGPDEIYEINAQQSFSSEVVSVEETKSASRIFAFHRISKWVYIFISQYHQAFFFCILCATYAVCLKINDTIFVLRRWLRYCATSWKIAGSIPDEVIGF